MAEESIKDKKNILVIGGAGFIGSHLCDDLVKKYNVICIDNFISSSSQNIEHLLPLENFVFLNIDINTINDIEKFPETERFDIKFRGIQEVYNLATPTSPRNFKKFKVETAITNAQGTINALNLALKYRAKFLQFSSSVVYGQSPDPSKPLGEDEYFPLDPLSTNAVYDEGKRNAETLVMTYREKFDLDAKVIRIFRTYGPRNQLFEGHMIPDFIVAALDNKPLIIYGDEDFSTSLIYVDDVISACHKIMNSTESGPFNIGNPMSYKLVDVAQMIIDKTNSSSQIKFEKSLQFMRQLSVPDITLAKEKIDWFPVVTLEHGLDKTIEYTQAHKILIDWSKVNKIEE